MNRTYRVIWNASLGAWVAVSEIAKSKTKNKNGILRLDLGTEDSGKNESKTKIFKIALLAMCIGGFTQANATQVITTTGTGVGIEGGYGAVSTDAGKILNYWLNPYAHYLADSYEASGMNTLGSIALGAYASALDPASIAIGSHAKTERTNFDDLFYSNSMSIGDFSYSSNGGMALGVSSTSTGIFSVAMGRESAATATSAVAIGSTASAVNTSAIAVGTSSVATGLRSVAIGSSSASDKKYNDTHTEASGTDSVALGTDAQSEGDNSLAAGTAAVASANNAIAVGANSEASSEDTIALGTGAVASGVASSAIGFNADASGWRSVAIGWQADASGEFSTAIGQAAVASETWNTAIGSGANATGEWTTALGSGAYATADYTTAVGFFSDASAEGATSIGHFSSATQENSVALGTLANTDTDATSEDTAIVGKLTYSGFAGQAADTGMQVSIGSVGAERQLKNVAAGKVDADSTDAINGSQLYATNAVLSNVADSTVNLIGGGVTLDTNGSITGPFQVNNTDYSTIAEAIEAAKTEVKEGKNVSVTEVIGDNGQSIYMVSTSEDVSFTTVNTTNLTATGDTKLGDSFTVNNGGTYYTGDITDGNHITNKTYVDNQTAAARSVVAAGTNVADVLKTTDADTGQDIYTVNAQGTTASAGSSAVTVTASAQADNVTDYVVDLSDETKESLVKADSALQSIETQIDGVTVKNVNKDDNKVNFVTGDNVELTANADGSITVGTAADVSFTTVNTTNLTATGDTKLGDSFTVNNGGAYYSGPIIEGDHIVNKNYVDSTKTKVEAGLNTSVIYDEASNTYTVSAAAVGGVSSEVKAGTNVVSIDKAVDDATGNVAYTVNAQGTTASAGSSAVTVTASAQADNVTEYAVDLSDETKESLVKADSALQSIETQIDGVTVKNVNKDDNKVNFVTGDNVELTANADGSITVGTAADVTFTTVNTMNLTATGDTHLGDSFTVNNGGAYYSGPITEGDHIVNKNYVDSTKTKVEAGLNTSVIYDEASNTYTVSAAAVGGVSSEVKAGTNVVSIDKAVDDATGNVAYTVNAQGTTASAGSSAVTVTASAQADNVTDYAVDLSDETKESLVKADSALQSIETQIDGVTVKNVNKDDNKVNFVTGDNVELTANADGSITVGTAADVTFTTVNTTNLTATGDTHLGDSFTVNNGGTYYTGDITEGNHITNKTYVDNQTAAARSVVAAGTNVADVVKTTDAETGQDIYTVNAQGTTASAGSSAVTVTASAQADNVTDYAVDLSDETKESLVKADSALQSIETQIDGVTVKNVNKDDNKVNFVTGDNVELTANADGSITVGTAADVTFTTVNTTNLTATGDTHLGDSFTVNNGGAYYSGPITEGNHITNKTYVDGQTAAAKTVVEEGKNIQVTSSVGEDGQNIYTVATAEDVDFTSVTVGNTVITTDGLTIDGGPSITTDGINAGGKKVTSVADGDISEDSSDAINGSQLYALGNNVTELFGGNATYVNNQISWTNIGGTGQSNIDDAIKYVNDQAANANQGWNVATDSGSEAASNVKPGDTVNINGDSASGVTVTNDGNDITVGLGDQIKVGSGNNAVSIDGNAGTIQVGDVHIDGTSGNITAGQVTVNGEAGTVNGLTNTTWDPDNITSGQAATEDQLKQVSQNAAQAAAAAKATVTAGDNITVTSTQNEDGSTNYQVATNKDVKFDSVTSGAVITDKVTVGNVTIDQAGINAGGSTVTNVANGAISSTSTDAINGSQLHASNTQIYNYLGGGANYETNTGPTYNVGGGTQYNVGDALDALDQRDNQLDQKITNLGDQLQQSFYSTNQRIDDVEKRANAGIAAAMALETAPFVAGKWTYAAAAAYHGGENAVGVTFRKTADNGRWSLTSGIAAASEGDPSFRIGISGVID